MANILITTEMLSDLKLQGNELLVYALINGFSKDGQGCFYGTREYIAQSLNMSVPTVARVLKKLTSQGLLRKGSIVHDGVAKPTYVVAVARQTVVEKKEAVTPDTPEPYPLPWELEPIREQPTPSAPELKKEKISAKKEKENKAIPASVEEVAAYCREKGITISAEAFFNYHASSGWMIGKNKMKDWRAAVRYWAANETKRQTKSQNYDRRTNDIETPVIATSADDYRKSFGEVLRERELRGLY